MTSELSQQRRCPHCDSDNITLVQRGLTGTTDEHDQYFTCNACGRTTYEIIARTPREVRVGRLDPGRQVRHEGNEYLVSRVLKVGLNESLVYLRPTADEPTGAPRGSSTRLPPRRR